MNQTVENKKMMDALSNELLNTINSIQGLLVLAQYHESRTEVNTYLGFISTCILKVEEMINRNQNINTQEDTCNCHSK
jgi:hypothetical protein